MTVTEVIEAALALSDTDREVVMQQLAVSFDRDDSRSDEEITAAWDKEIRSRVDDILTGKVQTIPWGQVMEEARLVAAESN